MKSAIQCAFLSVARDAVIKTTAAGQEYLAVTVTPLKEEGERIWVSAFHNYDELIDQIKPEQVLYVEGTMKLVRWDRAGTPQSALRVTAERIEIMFDLDARPKPRAKPAAKAAALAEMAPAAQPALLLPGAGEDEKKLKSATGLYQAPAAVDTGKRYDRPFADPLPF